MSNIRRNISIDNCNLFVTSHRMYTLYICSCTSNVCADSNIQMSVAHAQNVKYTKCMRWLFNPSKERCWTHAKDVFTYKFLQSYVRRYTCGEQTRQKKILGRQGKMHVHTCTHMYVRTHTCGDREDVDKYWGKMHCPLKVSRAMKTTRLPEATITLTGGRGEENDDPQRLRKVDWTETVSGTYIHVLVGARGEIAALGDSTLFVSWVVLVSWTLCHRKSRQWVHEKSSS